MIALIPFNGPRKCSCVPPMTEMDTWSLASDDLRPSETTIERGRLLLGLIAKGIGPQYLLLVGQGSEVPFDLRQFLLERLCGGTEASRFQQRIGRKIGLRRRWLGSESCQQAGALGLQKSLLLLQRLKRIDLSPLRDGGAGYRRHRATHHGNDFFGIAHIVQWYQTGCDRLFQRNAAPKRGRLLSRCPPRYQTSADQEKPDQEKPAQNRRSPAADLSVKATFDRSAVAAARS